MNRLHTALSTFGYISIKKYGNCYYELGKKAKANDAKIKSSLKKVIKTQA
jgi:hypothetical protein